MEHGTLDYRTLCSEALKLIDEFDKNVDLDEEKDKDEYEYELAVRLFRLFVGCHPYAGRLFRDKGESDNVDYKKICATSPPFIFDPFDDSNSPVTDIEYRVTMSWRECPLDLQMKFMKCFIGNFCDFHDGMYDRLTRSEWMETFKRV